LSFSNIFSESIRRFDNALALPYNHFTWRVGVVYGEVGGDGDRVDPWG
jgi:hypothetical protein